MQSVTRRGQTFQVSENSIGFWDRFGTEAWEKPTLDVFDTCIDHTTVCLDIGAWIGPTVLYSARCARKVIALEPDPKAAEELRTNVAANPDIAPKIEILERALSTQSGPREIGARTGFGDSMSSFVHTDAAETTTVECVSVDDLMERIAPSDKLFIKLDIEGAEYEVAPFLKPLLERTNVDVLVSFHPRFAAGGHPRFHKTFPMTRSVFKVFDGLHVTRVGRKNVLPATDVDLLRKTGLWLFEAKHSFLFSSRKRPVSAFWGHVSADMAKSA